MKLLRFELWNQNRLGVRSIDVGGKDLEPKIFISHRHKEREIASIIHDALISWHFKDEDIYYSSEPIKTHTLSGDDLSASIAKAVNEVKLFILVYTMDEGNWDWVMHESGLAIDPSSDINGEQPNTRIVIFQCFEDEPKILTPKLKVRIDEESILNFVTGILTEDNFLNDEPVPRSDLRYRPDILRGYASKLYENLSEALSSRQRPRIQCRWDYFTVELDRNSIEEAKGSDNIEEKLNIISTESLVIGRYALGLNHFGYSLSADTERHFSEDRDLRNENIKLQNVFERWMESSEYQGSELPNWALGILEEMKRTIDSKYAVPPKFLMKSISIFREDWFYPVVNTVKKLSNGNMEFDIYMFRIPSSLPWLDRDNI